MGEMKFLRGLNYSEMLKRYGGVPIIDKRVDGAEASDIKRSTVEVRLWPKVAPTQHFYTLENRETHRI